MYNKKIACKNSVLLAAAVRIFMFYVNLKLNMNVP